jgi:Family of unknown function (DUF6510)
MSAEPRHLDGNAVGGWLIEAFGREMTEAIERCGGCGSVRELGALHAYAGGPGDVLRCPDCGLVLLVIVRLGGRLRIGAGSMAWLDLPG